MHDVIQVEAMENYRLRVKFEDGVTGEVDVSKQTEFRGIFESLRDAAHFRQVFVHPELKVVCWPNGADLDSDVLYSTVTGKPLVVSAPTNP